jgi:hypothetical protein
MATPAESHEGRTDDEFELHRFAARIPMLCECGTHCESLVMIPAEAYRNIRSDPQVFLAAPGHDVVGAELEFTSPDYSTFRSRGAEQQAA